VTPGTNFERFRAKAAAYLKEHEDHVALQHLRRVALHRPRPTGPDFFFFPDTDVEVIVDTLHHIKQTAMPRRSRDSPGWERGNPFEGDPGSRGKPSTRMGRAGVPAPAARRRGPHRESEDSRS